MRQLELPAELRLGRVQLSLGGLLKASGPRARNLGRAVPDVQAVPKAVDSYAGRRFTYFPDLDSCPRFHEDPA